MNGIFSNRANLLLRVLRNILLFSLLFLYIFEGATFGSYSFSISIFSSITNDFGKHHQSSPENIRPVWSQKKHIKVDEKISSLFICKFFSLHDNDAFQRTPLFVCDYGLIDFNVFSEIKERAPPLT
jgi:hypothetical protein